MANRTYGIGLLAGVCTLAMAAPALAQAAAEGTEVDSKEIVVTAQNRSQNVQDVPIAIDVVNAEALKKTGHWNPKEGGAPPAATWNTLEPGKAPAGRSGS